MKWALVRIDINKIISLSEDTQHGVGRGKECTIKCQSLYSSRHHCDIISKGDEICVVDLKSSNGTFVNGNLITSGEPLILKENDLIGIGVPEILDNKSIVYKLVKKDVQQKVENSIQTDGKRKRNLDDSEFDQGAPKKVICVEEVVGTFSKPKSDVNSSLPESLSSPSMCTSTPISSSKPPEFNGSVCEPSSDKPKESAMEVIDLVDSDEEESESVIKDRQISPDEKEEDSSVTKVMDSSGYADENDVIVISDDEDFFSSSQVSNSVVDVENEDNLLSEGVSEKEVEKGWDTSESEEESDNEWWPKLSQSFSENTPEDKQGDVASTDGRTSGDEGVEDMECISVDRDHKIDASHDERISLVNETGEDDDVDIVGEGEAVDGGDDDKPADSENDDGSWFPKLSCGFSDSEDEREENADDEVENELQIDEGKDVAEEGMKLVLDDDDEEGDLLIDEGEGSEGNSDVDMESKENVEDVLSVTNCAKDLSRVRISQKNESTDGTSDESSRYNSVSSDLNVSKEKSLQDEKNKVKVSDELRILLNAKNERRGPQLVTAPTLKKGRICVWEKEKERESEPPENVSSLTSKKTTETMDMKTCHVVLEDIMYDMKKQKVKKNERRRLSKSSKSTSHSLLSKAEKNKIKEKRKLKLQALSEKEPKYQTSPEAMSPEGRNEQEADKISPSVIDSSKESRAGKVAAKVTAKNRGAFLTEFDLFGASASAPPKKDKKAIEKGKKFVIPIKEKTAEKDAYKLIRVNSDLEARNSTISPLSESHANCERTVGISQNLNFIAVNEKNVHGILRRSDHRKNLKVSFKEAHEVHTFAVSPGSKLMPVRGKDSPLRPTNKPGSEAEPSTAQPTSVMPVVYDMCRWNAMWLEEQRSKSASEPPPVNHNKSILPILGNYSSYNEYFSAFYPNLLLELWAKVYKEWDQNFVRNQVVQVLLESVGDVPESSLAARQEFVMINCQCFIPEKNSNFYPKMGDFCLLDLPEEIPVGSNDNLNQTSTVTVRLFAYVENIRRNHFSSTSSCKDFGNGPEAAISLNMMLKVKKRAFKICIGKTAKLKLVFQLSNDLKTFQGLFNLKKSPLLQQVLNPRSLGLKTFIPGNIRLKTTDVLNSTQEKAVAMARMICLGEEPRIGLIQGPPGTGKTKVIVTLLMELFEYQKKTLSQKRRENKTPRVLLCAPSNAAIDNLVIKLLAIRMTLEKENRFRMVRVGRLDAMNPAVREISLQELTTKDLNNCANNFDNGSLDLQISTMLAKINSLRMALESAILRKDLKNQLQIEGKIKETERRLEEVRMARVKNVDNMSNKDRRELEHMKERNILRCADIVATTLSSSVNYSMLDAFSHEAGRKSHFTCCIIDEAAQSMEVDSLIPLQLGMDKLLLVGDQEQLYPTIISLVAKQNGLQTSLFERLWSSLSEHKIDPSQLPMVLLNVQYRMHPEICNWPNFHVYNGLLETPSVLEMERQSPFLPYVVISLEFDQNDPNQLLNCSEAELVSKLYFAMSEKAEKRQYSIGIITPYQKQKNAIEAALSRRRSGKSIPSSVEVNTIDSFQGQERDIVILSCVRSYGIGFLGERRRINVALTRARRSLIVCGNFTSLKDHDLWNAFLADGLSRSKVRCISGSNVPNQKELLNLVLR